MSNPGYARITHITSAGFVFLRRLFCREKEQELTRGGTTEVSPAMAPWRNSDPTKKSSASAEIAHAAKRCALLPPGVTRN
jgi:hypothetical protein